MHKLYDTVMEVVETMGNEEDGASVTKTIRLVVASGGGESTKFRKIEGPGSEQITNILVCSPQGNYGDIVLHSSGDMVLPIATEKKSTPLKVIDMSNSVKISTVPCPTQKRQMKGSIITVYHAKPSSSAASTTCVQLGKPTVGIPIKSKQGSSTLDLPQIRLQNKSDTVSRIIVSSDIHSKPQSMSTTTTVKTPLVNSADLQGKVQCASFLDDQLPLLTEVSDKSTATQSTNSSNCQTVMMRVNSNGELEFDPMFINTDALTELEVEESSSGKREELIVADEDPLDYEPAKTQREVGNANVNQNWFTSREDKEMYRWRGHAWRQGMWSREETELLQKNIMEYCMDRNLSDPGSVIFKMSKEERSGFYRIIAKGLNRPLFSIYRRVVRLYDNRNHIGKYTTEEVNKLRELRMKHGNNWQAIAALLGRSAASVKDRCRLLNENCNRGAWTVEEEDRLSMAVYDLASVFPGEQVTSGISWGEVSSRVKTRSEKQCRTKWLNYLNWKRTSGVEWSKADDIQLICRLSVCGVEEESQVDWSVLARGWPACRSPHWLRGKWWHLKKRLPDSSENSSLGEMCQLLYNLQPLNLLQSTLVELPTAGAASSTTSAASGSVDEKGSSGSPGTNLPTGTVKLCIPAANFASIINSDNRDEEFASKLSALVQTALVVPSNEVASGQPVTSLVSQPNGFTSSPLTSHIPLSLSTQLTSTLISSSKSQAIVVENLENSMIHLSEVARSDDRDTLLEPATLRRVVKEEHILRDSKGSAQSSLSRFNTSSPGRTSQVILNAALERVVKEENILSDSEGTSSQSGLSRSIDPSSPARTSQVILNGDDKGTTAQSCLSGSLNPSSPAGNSRVILNATLERVVKEDILSDSEGTNSQTGLSTSLDPSSPAGTSQVILNDPILSVSGEPLGREEGLQLDHDDTDITIV